MFKINNARNSIMNNNIWEVSDASELTELLKANPDKYILVGIVLAHTPKNKINMIRKFMKVRSKQYPNMLFIFLNAKSSNLGKISLLKKNPLVYPLLYYICDVSEIMGHVENVELETMVGSFQNFEDYFIEDREAFLEEIQETEHTEEGAVSEHSNATTQEKSKPAGSNKNNKVQEKLRTVEDREEEELNNKKREKAKIVFLQKKGEELADEFYRDVAKRKELENKNKKKDELKSKNNKR